jgi:riboflavin kinase
LVNATKLKGKIISGQGNGKKYLALPWVRQQIEKLLGFNPYLGTLNLKLSKDNARRRRLLEKVNILKIRPAEGYCVGLLFKSSIGEIECGIVIPQVDGYPENLLEIIALVDLRALLHLSDGDTLSITVSF